MINIFTGKVSNWYTGLTDDAKGIIKNDTIEGFKEFIQEGIKTLVQFIGNEFVEKEPPL